MKVLIYFVVTLIALSNGQVDDNIGNLLRSYSEISDSKSCSNIYGSMCKDCNTLWTCLGDDKPLLEQNCGVAYPNQPYCVDDQCTSEIDEKDPTCSAGTKCTAEGYFPNPRNCSQFVLCSGPLGDSFLYECPTGFVYNSISKSCARRGLPVSCSTINCELAANINKYVVYPGDKQYYAFCYNNNGVSDTIMFRCDDNLEYNQKTRKCEFQCSSEGRVADLVNCQKYYECYKVGANYVTSHQACPRDFIYDGTVKQCVKGTCPPIERKDNEQDVDGVNGGE